MSKAAAAKAKAASKPRARKQAASDAVGSTPARTDKSAAPKSRAAKSAGPAAKPRVAKSKAASPKAGPARKAKPPVLVDLAPQNATLKLILAKSAYTDYMVVTTGRSNRHVGAVAENVVKGLKESGVKPVHVEGLTNCDWVLIDSGDVIVHVFRPEVREFYNLERMWTQPQSDAIAKPA